MIKIYTNPINVATFYIGLAMLLLGAENYHVPDWDIRVTFIMALLAYFLAPISVALIREDCTNLVHWFWAVFLAWVTVDWSYTAYWTFVNPNALVLREVQWLPSLCLYLLGGIIWYYTANIMEKRNGME